VSDGSWRFSGGRATPRAIGQQQFGPARRVRFCLQVKPVPQGRDQVVVRQLVSIARRSSPWTERLSSFPSGSAGVMRRIHHRGYGADRRSPRAAGIARCVQQFLPRPHVALDVGARFGQQAFSTARAAF